MVCTESSVWARFVTPQPAGFSAAAKPRSPFCLRSNQVWSSCYHKSPGKFMSPRRQELLKIPICFIVTKTSAMKPLPATILLHVWRATAAGQKAFQPTHWPYITRRVLMPTFSFGRRPCTTNICCRSHRTCGLQTAHLLFWECLSLASHNSLKDNEGFVLENPHSFSQCKRKNHKKSFCIRPRNLPWSHLTGTFIG